MVVFTLERKLLGVLSYLSKVMSRTNDNPDLFDNVYDLVDSLTFKLRRISPNMWRVYELTYALFKAEAVDFLEGE